jgi:cellulose synthase (UDP-forming)
LAVAAPYLAWRAAFTLDERHLAYSAVFFVAEAWCVVMALASFYWMADRPRRPEPEPPDARWTVDVLVATCNEDAELLRKTLVAARDMDHPHRTWACDDGRRPEVAALARELGVGYLTRADNADYKAGNLNNALASTHGDFVVCLDADHVVRRDLLTRLLGHFHDPAVAFVQTPQVYYNVDSFQHAVSTPRRRLWHESAVFHHAIQPGADRLNASFFVGTGAILRRSALERIGGFATGSVTEDILTAIRLHDAGRRSVYVDEALGFLLAPDTPAGYVRQRQRWAEGGMQILRREHPLRKKGLSGWQRAYYMFALHSFFTAWPNLLFYLVPAVYVFWGVNPIAAPTSTGIPIVLGHLVLSQAACAYLSRPHHRFFHTECYKLLTLPAFLAGTLAILRPDGIAFRVTPKGRHGGVSWGVVLPVAAIFGINLTAVGFGLARLVLGMGQVGVLLMALLFSGLFALAGAFALRHALVRRAAEEPFTFPVAMPSSLATADGRLAAIVLRLSDTHAYVRCQPAPPVGETVSLDLTRAGVDEPVRAHVVGAEAGEAGVLVKLALDPLSGAERDRLDHVLFQEVLPSFLERFVEAPRPASGRELAPERALRELPELLPVRAALV